MIFKGVASFFYTQMSFTGHQPSSQATKPTAVALKSMPVCSAISNLDGFIEYLKQHGAEARGHCPRKTRPFQRVALQLGQVLPIVILGLTLGPNCAPG